MRKLPRPADIRLGAVASALALVVGVAFAQSSAIDEIAKYRAALQDGNPAELWEARGEGLWKEPRGPNKVSFEKCDLGLGPGVVKGAYTQMPRYFADADRVMDLETRIVWCKVKLQGFSEADAKKNPFGGPDNKADMEALVAYVTSESCGVKMSVSAPTRRNRRPIVLVKKMFYFRGGSHDFACATCRGVDNQRIRLQDLPICRPRRVRRRPYDVARVSRLQGELRTFQWRLNDCFRQQRFPELSSRRMRRSRSRCSSRKRERRRVRCACDQALEANAMTRRIIGWAIVAAAASVVIGCATAPTDAEVSAKATQVLRRRSRRAGRLVWTVRPGRNAKTCTEYAGKPLPKDVAEKMKDQPGRDQMAGRRKLLGDWRNGEKIAQAAASSIR
jgi:sulfur-oxidizing protein SoxA